MVLEITESLGLHVPSSDDCFFLSPFLSFPIITPSVHCTSLLLSTHKPQCQRSRSTCSSASTRPTHLPHKTNEKQENFNRSISTASNGPISSVSRAIIGTKHLRIKLQQAWYAAVPDVNYVDL